MIQKIDEPVCVSLISKSRGSRVYPSFIKWRGRIYKIKKLGFHHIVPKGKDILHVFSVVSENLFFRLVLDSRSLLWKIEEISDGEAN